MRCGWQLCGHGFLGHGAVQVADPNYGSEIQHSFCLPAIFGCTNDMRHAISMWTQIPTMGFASCPVIHVMTGRMTRCLI